jgi:hypothetical protein
VKNVHVSAYIAKTRFTHEYTEYYRSFFTYLERLRPSIVVKSQFSETFTLNID